MMTVAACLWTGLFPLLQFGTYSHITADKWIIMLALTAFTLIAAVCEVPGPLRPAGSFSRARKTILAVFALLTLWMMLSCLLSPLGSDSWWIGASARREGLFTQLCYMLLFLVFSFSRVRQEPVILSAAAGVLVFCAVVLFQRSGINVFGLYPAGRSYATTPEFQGTIGNVDMDTGYLVLLCGLFLPALQQPRRREENPPAARRILFRITVLAGLAAAVYLVISMDVQFGAITLAVLAVTAVLRFIPRRWRIPFIILLVILALLFVWFFPGSSGGLWELHEIMHGRPQLSFGSNRVAVWVYSVGLAQESLLIGGGSDTFEIRFNQYINENGLAIPTHQGDLALPHYFDNPHNEYIAHLVNHGLPAMLLFAALLLLLVFLRPRTAGFRSDSQLTPCAAAVLCYAVQAFFAFSVCLVAPVFWVIAGICAAEK